MSQSVVLGIKPYTPSTLPSEQSLIDAGKAVFSNLDSWKPVKTFKNQKGHHPYTVKTFVKPKAPTDEMPWYMRYSVHTPAQDGTFDDFWNLLGKNKAINEKEFIPEIKSIASLKTISPTQSIWTLHYTFTPPVSPRTFTVCQVVHISGGEHGSPREGWIVSVPVDVSEDPEMKSKEVKGTRGRYASVELIREGENGLVEWRMATASTPGGLIPRFLVLQSMPSQIEKDVGHFLDWMDTKKKKKASKSASAAVSAEPAAAASTAPPTETANGQPTAVDTGVQEMSAPAPTPAPAPVSAIMADEVAMNAAPSESATAPTADTNAVPSDAPATADE